ncbi:MAG: hypothetical protein A4S15_01255 [Candidatus Raskinella chloraquaticus]|uniref:Uncharacterized protein n=1 Tax=Candidatus Raskinella chloraquaticus TaxID=1951219 RepID=A0A1W9HS30_9HYPH|nr:MAG: hypothetical protein A4S15_01255 [Proteobacteria bacterium SG_bin8]
MQSANESVVYRQRPHALSPDVEFALAGGVLSWADKKGRTGALEIAQLRHCRILYDASRLSAPRWIVDLQGSDRQELRFTSTTTAGAGGMRSRNGAFLAFLGHVHAALAAQAPGAICRFGPGLLTYCLHSLLWCLPVLGMFWAAYLGFTTSGILAGVFFTFLALYSGQFALRYAYYNWPRIYDPRHPPLHLLPKPSPHDV